MDSNTNYGSKKANQKPRKKVSILRSPLQVVTQLFSPKQKYFNPSQESELANKRMRQRSLNFKKIQFYSILLIINHKLNSINNFAAIVFPFNFFMYFPNIIIRTDTPSLHSCQLSPKILDNMFSGMTVTCRYDNWSHINLHSGRYGPVPPSVFLRRSSDESFVVEK